MLSDKISDRTIVLLILYNNSLKNFASPQGIWIFHFSLFTLHLANSSSKCKFIVFCLKSILLGLKTPVFSLVCC